MWNTLNKLYKNKKNIPIHIYDKYVHYLKSTDKLFTFCILPTSLAFSRFMNWTLCITCVCFSHSVFSHINSSLKNSFAEKGLEKQTRWQRILFTFVYNIKIYIPWKYYTYFSIFIYQRWVFFLKLSTENLLIDRQISDTCKAFFIFTEITQLQE